MKKNNTEYIKNIAKIGGYTISTTADYIPQFKHLYKRKPDESELEKLSRCYHLTSSDVERATNLQREFGPFKCKKCQKFFEEEKK